jgi:TfoX/Sxy family transcriptional regulator of competence genes
MAFDESVADRLRKAMKDVPSVAEQKMFGGLAFLVKDKMCCGVLANSLVLRLGKEGASEALRQPHTRTMDFTGKPIMSMVYVDPAGYATKASLRARVQLALRFVTSPPKPSARVTRPRSPRPRRTELPRRRGA